MVASASNVVNTDKGSQGSSHATLSVREQSLDPSAAPDSPANVPGRQQCQTAPGAQTASVSPRIRSHRGCCDSVYSRLMSQETDL
ncbi:Piso0_000461 [Millerozyma farinosa CBS 7064]|uniref:Piso0_000461 protein n=1 Tax=Pichia sorbitophila (strain ATCC MYA-4447 / BCRC 22081 / CBS 7064 / NBRC 10061 / NRRL Y-12695) TaxID=559304 RepID=G8YVH7_PICSO|nr:Piso0_000461 [Millerozyma farinosa CBS 7064]CCE73421.1 Piso0_000461 [Millerozyma farinosa CBS 7064]